MIVIAELTLVEDLDEDSGEISSRINVFSSFSP